MCTRLQKRYIKNMHQSTHKLNYKCVLVYRKGTLSMCTCLGQATLSKVHMSTDKPYNKCATCLHSASNYLLTTSLPFSSSNLLCISIPASRATLYLVQASSRAMLYLPLRGLKCFLFFSSHIAPELKKNPHFTDKLSDGNIQ